MNTSHQIKLTKSYQRFKVTIQKAELGAAALAGRIASRREDDQITPDFTCEQIYQFKQDLRPFLFLKHGSVPVWLSKRCRHALKQNGHDLKGRVSRESIVQKWLKVHELHIWDHWGVIGKNMIFQPYAFDDFQKVYDAFKGIHVAVVSKPGEKGFHHPATYLYEIEESYPVTPGKLSWTADEGWVGP